MGSEISVKDLIQTNYIKDICRVVAGEKGLDKGVNWVHILEIQDIVGECVDGGEMVLTTGVEFTSSKIALAFVKTLIDAGVAALCIETALYYHKIDASLIQLANEQDFPLIEITVISRFKDICKGMNSLILQKKSNPYERAESYDSRLNDEDSIGTIEDGIRYTADYLDIEVAYLPERGRSFVTSPVMDSLMETNLKKMREIEAREDLYSRGRIAVKSLIINGKSYGCLIFKSNHEEISEFERMILGRLANKVKTDLLKELHKSEEKLYEDNKWIMEWLQGDLTLRDIREHLDFVGAVESYSGLFVCSGKLEKPVLFRDFILHMGLDVRKAFEDEGFFVLGYPAQEHISFLVFDRADKADSMNRIRRVIRELRETENPVIDYSGIVFSIGKRVTDWESMKKSYRTSLEFAAEWELASDGIVVFDDLYVNRLLAKMAHTDILEEFVSDHLGRLLLTENQELLQTLDMYLRCNCSKQRTAERLYIVRQTLYFRLQKLEEILGQGFDEGERKLALELALRGYFYGSEKHLTECICEKGN